MARLLTGIQVDGANGRDWATSGTVYRIQNQSFSSRFAFRALTEMMWRCDRWIFAFWRGFGEGAGLKHPVTEPKRRQKAKGPGPQASARRYSIYGNALAFLVASKRSEDGSLQHLR